jgi:hypothetical protein
MGEQAPAERAAGVGAGEILGAEAARVEQGHGEGIAQASAAVVLAVGARLSGQASSATPASRWASASRASEEAGLPVMAISGRPGA